jgi:hypothetical protein
MALGTDTYPSTVQRTEHTIQNYFSLKSLTVLEELSELCLLLGEVVMQEVERVLLEETGHILNLHTNTNSRPDLYILAYSGHLSSTRNCHWHLCFLLSTI